MNFLEQLNLRKDLAVSDFHDLGQKILSNILANVPSYHRSKRGRELFGKFQNIPSKQSKEDLGRFYKQSPLPTQNLQG